MNLLLLVIDIDNWLYSLTNVLLYGMLKHDNQATGSSSHR